MGYEFFIYIIYIEIIVGMARNRSMRRMRNRSRSKRCHSRGKRGGWNFPWSEIEKFKKKLREINSINDVMNDTHKANLYKLTPNDKNEILTKLRNDFNDLGDEGRSKLSKQINGADKKDLYQKVYSVLEEKRLENTDHAEGVQNNPSGIASEFANPVATQSDSTTPPDPSDMRIPTQKPTGGPGGFKHFKVGGKSGRRRHHRRRTNKIRKSRKGRKIRRN
jgi:hypothetical protein